MHRVFLTSYVALTRGVSNNMHALYEMSRFIRNEHGVYNVFMHDDLQFVGFSVFLLRVAISLSLATGSFYHIYV